MLSPRWRKMLRDASLAKARTALVIVAVVVGMTGAGALLDAWALVRAVTAATFVASNPVSATLRVDRADDALLASIRNVPGVAAVRARRVAYAAIDANGRRLRGQIFALSDWHARDIGHLLSEQGAWPPRDGELVIEHSSLEFSGATPGGTLRASVGRNAAVALPIAGVARDVSLPPGWMDHVVYAFATPATLAQLGLPAAFDEVQFVASDAPDRDAVRRIAYAVKATIERGGGRVTMIDVPVPGEHAHAAQMDSLSLTQGAFALLTLVVCALLVVNLVTAMLAAQTRQIGVMKALGASAAQIGALYLVFAAALGVVATLVALPAAVAIARPYAAMKLDMLNFPLGDAAIPAWALVVQFLVGCLLPVMAALLPVMRACHMPAADALRDPGIAADGGRVTRRFALPGIGRPLQLSIGNAFRRRQRMLLTVLALAAGGAVYLGASNLRDGVRASVAHLFAGVHYDVTLRLADDADAARVEAVAASVPGIAGVQASARERAAVRHDDGLDGNTFALIGLPAVSPLVVPAIEQGRGFAADDGNVLVVSRNLLKDEPGLQLRTETELRIGETSTRWRVIGVVDAGPQAFAWAPAAALAAVRGDARVSTLLVALASREPAAQLDAILRLRAALDAAGFTVAGSERVAETRRAFEDHLVMVVQFLGVMAWAMIAIGGIGLASTMSLGVLERTREIGVMRAIGAPDGAIFRLVQVEGLVVAGLAWLVSLVLSVPIGQVLADAFGRVMFAVPMRAWPNAGGAFAWAAMLALVSLVACTWPARRAVRLSAARALAYE
jgi:putative ABC transport system permease protein